MIYRYLSFDYGNHGYKNTRYVNAKKYLVLTQEDWRRVYPERLSQAALSGQVKAASEMLRDGRLIVKGPIIGNPTYLTAALRHQPFCICKSSFFPPGGHRTPHRISLPENRLNAGSSRR